MERLEIVREKKQQHQEKLVQEKIKDAFNKLPETAKKRGGRKGETVGANRSKRKHMEKVEGQER